MTGSSGLRTGVLLAATALAGNMITSHPAAAQDAAQLQAIQQQIAQLQTQLRRLEREAAARDRALKQAQEDAAQARAQATAAESAAAARPAPVSVPSTLVVPPTVPPGSGIVTIPPNDKDAYGQPIFNPNKPNGKFNIGGVTVSLGGFVDLTGIYRSRNQNRGTATSFSGIPFRGPTPQGNTTEFGLTAQQTRLSVRLDGKLDAYSSITGYVESDFNNGAGGANSVQSNSYTPRLRQAFGVYDNKRWEAYGLAGQAWSLATPFKKGLDPFSNWQPVVIDTAYLPGYSYLRVPEVRVVKGFGPAWFGLEADAAQTVFGGTAVAATPGGSIQTAYAGNGGLNPQNNYTLNSVPDLIGKAAIDTSFGHYEVFGLYRQFQNQNSFRLNATNTAGGSFNKYADGGGVGGTAFISVRKYFDIYASILTGNGVGRYGAGGLPDVTFAANGSLKPLHETMGLVGVVGHVLPAVDLYVFGGLDQVSRSYFVSGTTPGGYGNPGFQNTGCFNPNASVGTPAGPACTGNNYQVRELTAGYNWKIWSGPYGIVSTGLQYGYAQRQAYRGVGGKPNADTNLVFLNLRYTPFP